MFSRFGFSFRHVPHPLRQEQQGTEGTVSAEQGSGIRNQESGIRGSGDQGSEKVSGRFAPACWFWIAAGFALAMTVVCGLAHGFLFLPARSTANSI
jgi:hypothetical protein